MQAQRRFPLGHKGAMKFAAASWRFEVQRSALNRSFDYSQHFRARQLMVAVERAITAVKTPMEAYK